MSPSSTCARTTARARRARSLRAGATAPRSARSSRASRRCARTRRGTRPTTRPSRRPRIPRRSPATTTSCAPPARRARSSPATSSTPAATRAGCAASSPPPRPRRSSGGCTTTATSRTARAGRARRARHGPGPALDRGDRSARLAAQPGRAPDAARRREPRRAGHRPRLRPRQGQSAHRADVRLPVAGRAARPVRLRSRPPRRDAPAELHGAGARSRGRQDHGARALDRQVVEARARAARHLPRSGSCVPRPRERRAAHGDDDAPADAAQLPHERTPPYGGPPDSQRSLSLL